MKGAVTSFGSDIVEIGYCSDSSSPRVAVQHNNTASSL